MDNDGTKALLAQAKQGDLDAFGALVRLHEGAVRAYLAVRLNDASEVDDFGQDVFITAFRRLNTFDESKPFAPWLKGIAMNLLRNRFRKRMDIPFGDASDFENLLNARIEERESLADSGAMGAALNHCLGKLGDKANTLLRWRYGENMGMAELTRRLRCKHSAATMALTRIRAQMRQCMESWLGKDARHEYA